MPCGFIKHSAALCAAVIAALASFSAPSASAMPKLPEGHPAVSHPDRTLFELITAEIAVHRGDPHFAYEAWMDAAKNEKSARIAELAWQAAVTARDPEKTLAAAKLWLQFEPDSIPARQTLLADAVERNDASGISRQLSEFDRLPVAQGGKAGDWLAALLDSLSKLKPSEGLKTSAELLAPLQQKYAKRADISVGYAKLLGRTGQTAQACSLAAGATTTVKSKTMLREIVGQAADVCWQAGNAAQSRMLLEKYLKAHPKDSYILLIYGRVQERLGDRRGALTSLEKAMASTSVEPQIAYNAGELAADLGSAELTERYLNRYVDALREQSTDIDLSRLEVWVQLGNAALIQKAPERAAEYFSRLQGGPFAVDARIRQALALTDSGKPEAALAALREARTKLKLDAPMLMSAEAKLLLELNRSEEARSLIEEAANSYPSEAEVLYDAAMIEEELGRREEAEQYLRKLLALRPQHVQGANALGYLLTEENRNLAEARELLERAYRAEPLNPFILDSMGWLCFREGRYRAAAEFTTASLKRYWDAEVAAHLVEILAAQGKTIEAQNALEDFLRRGGSSATAGALSEKYKLSLPSVSRSPQ